MRDAVPIELPQHVSDLARELYDRLPHPLPDTVIRAVNEPKGDVHAPRSFSYNGWEFDVPPGVHLPGNTSRVIHDRMLDGTIPVAGRSFATVGCGLGVEAVIAGTLGARRIFASDVDAASVAATDAHYRRIIGERDATSFHPLVSDLFDRFPPGTGIDVVTFNGPMAVTRVSDDPVLVRNVCVGTEIAERFFRQLTERDVLSPQGEVYVLASNTADLRAVVGSALHAGLTPEIVHLRVREDVNLQTHLFRFRR